MMCELYSTFYELIKSCYEDYLNGIQPTQLDKAKVLANENLAYLIKHMIKNDDYDRLTWFVKINSYPELTFVNPAVLAKCLEDNTTSNQRKLINFYSLTR